MVIKVASSDKRKMMLRAQSRQDDNQWRSPFFQIAINATTIRMQEPEDYVDPIIIEQPPK